MKEIYSFDVTVSTHDLLKAGVVAARLPGSSERHHRIVVAAESRNEAALLAAQMARRVDGSARVCTTGFKDYAR